MYGISLSISFFQKYIVWKKNIFSSSELLCAGIEIWESLLANRGALREGREPARSVVINQEGHAKLATLSALSGWPPSRSMLLQSIDRPDIRATKEENHSTNTNQEKILLVWTWICDRNTRPPVTISRQIVRFHRRGGSSTRDWWNQMVTRARRNFLMRDLTR